MNKLIYLVLLFTLPTLSFAQVTTQVDALRSKIGIGTETPLYNLEVHHRTGVPSLNAPNGFYIKNTGSNQHNWTFYVNNGIGSLQLYKGITKMGEFDPTSGNYMASSDARLKKNIQTLTNQLAIIKRLRPTTYDFKDRVNARKVYGLIAQEVQKLIPDIVRHTGESPDNSTLAISYTELIPIIIAAMQEQQVIIEQQQEKETILTEQFNQQQEQIDALLKTVNQLSAQTSPPGKLNNAITIGEQFTLEQNHPNPFSRNTTINYTLPKEAKNALIRITNFNGQLIATYPINQTGQGKLIIDNQPFTVGIYFYSLQVNGQIIMSKCMMVSQ